MDIDPAQHQPVGHPVANGATTALARLEERIAALDRLIARELTLRDTALGEARATIDSRLLGMNELRDQILEERATLASLKYVDSEIDKLVIQVSEAIRRIAAMEVAQDAVRQQVARLIAGSTLILGVIVLISNNVL